MDTTVGARVRLIGLILAAAAVWSPGCGEPRSWEEINEAARAAHEAGDYAKAEKEFRAAVRVARKLGEHDERLVRSLNNLGSFKRSLRLNDTLDADNAAATFDNGVLTLSLPKLPEAQPRRIEVQQA